MNIRVEKAKPELIWPTDVTDIPTEVFVRDDIFEAEVEAIFRGPYWHAVAHEAEIPKPGDFKTFELGRVPLLIARGDDGVVRAFVNACSHRQNQVETATCGNSKGFECPYHRWTFRNDGSLAGCPGSEEFSPKFRKEEYGLKRIPMANVFGLILVSLADNPPDIEGYLDRGMRNIEKQIGHADGLKLLGYQKVSYGCNWKVIMDNDGYHAPLLHTGFRLLGWQSGRGEQFLSDFTGGVESELKPGKSTGILKDPSLIEFKDSEWDAGSFVTGIFPATIIVKHMDVISIRFPIARSADCTEVHYAYFGRGNDSDEMTRHRVRQASNLLGPCGMISMEDAAIFRRIQIASQARGTAIFQKGVKDLSTIPTQFLQNDESPNIPRWDHYRRLMGFRKEGEV
jgi:phenylpropionate dioxygenase-like ring-hydroxylating dioxygenase large terminal subunit